MINKLHASLEARYINYYALQRETDALAFRERHNMHKLRQRVDAVLLERWMRM